ncbi:MAG TPA: nucleotide exchange factor GrpE [Armatimonadota bacterium]|jgi:molecular chaperone GrpE
MDHKRRIHLGHEETHDASEAQKQRDKELTDMGSIPEEVLNESPEEADVVAEASSDRVLPEDIAKLIERCEAAEKRADEEHDTFLRTLAEYNNFRRRTREELEQARKFGIEDFIIRLLPVLDNFERGIKAAEEIENYEALHGGVILILRQLRDALEKEGVKPIDAEGQEFDPNIHEAVMRVDTEDYPDNTVIEEFQKGYTLGDKVIRPSMVRVAKHP